ncbi:MAG: N-acetyl sugar amidotransferase [Candidatus Roizmanbacteria bacterium]|nr:N-acetyl sugar amidotransferase [Candidatus Roizmanbacteria bacterium]
MQNTGISELDSVRCCTRCVMNSSAKNIRFNELGVCNYCSEYVNLLREKQYSDKNVRQALLEEVVNKIKQAGRGEEYDCLLGVSGGLDSSYTLYMSKKFGLRPLVVHLDNGWNSELAVSNIEKLVTNLDVDLYTHVIDWEEFKGLQIAFFKANVIDIEALTDHAITSILFKLSRKKRIKYIIGGTNIANEGMRMPPNWNNWAKMLDDKNIKSIYKKLGNGSKLKTYPMMGLLRYFMHVIVYKTKWVSILNYLDYEKEKATQILSNETGWRPYEKKHYESVFTRFYQGYILPKKFGVDKRRLHFSTLVCSGQMTREDALHMLDKDTYDNQLLLDEDKEYVLKKLGFSDEFFGEYINTLPVPHNHYPTNARILDTLLYFYKKLRPGRLF